MEAVEQRQRGDKRKICTGLMQLQIPSAHRCNSWSLFFQCGSITMVTLLDQGSEQENRNNDKLFMDMQFTKKKL